MWSVRMRASKTENDRERHISGAEGIYDFSEIRRALINYFERGVKHSRGQPDKIIITIEKINQRIERVTALPVNTFFSNSPDEAMAIVIEKLSSLSISNRAIKTALEVIEKNSMRGATLIDSMNGNRLEKDLNRGVRVSRIHMEKKRRSKILRQIKNLSSEPQRVIEALTIASKVASCKDILAELCISDNPDYTTGYIASRAFGYLRITNIKHPGDPKGGRAFFIKTPCDLENLINYLERTPVLVI